MGKNIKTEAGHAPSSSCERWEPRQVLKDMSAKLRRARGKKAIRESEEQG